MIMWSQPQIYTVTDERDRNGLLKMISECEEKSKKFGSEYDVVRTFLTSCCKDVEGGRICYEKLFRLARLHREIVGTFIPDIGN